MGIKRWVTLILIVLTFLSGSALAEPAAESNINSAQSAKSTAMAPAPALISETAVLMDAKTGQVLYNKDMHKQMFPASITKIMTTILAVENAKLSDKIIMTDKAVEAVSRSASHIALTGGEEITMEEAIYAALLVSANDACNGIAEAVSGSMEAFAKLMTEKAAEYGAQNTHFHNTNGLKDPEHYTTAYDMAAITRHALQNQTWRKMFGTLRYDMPANNKQKEVRILYNQHSMIADNRFYYKGIIGGKAGYTTAAKYTLVTAAERNGVELIAVVMKSPRNNDKYTDTKALLDYGFENFKAVQITDDKLSSHTLSSKNENGEEQSLEVKLEDPITVLIPINASADGIVTTCEIKDGEPVVSLTLPQNTGTIPQELGSFPLASTVKPTVAETPLPEETHGLSPLMLTLLIVGVLVGLMLIFIIVLFIRKEIYLRRRRRARRRRY